MSSPPSPTPAAASQAARDAPAENCKDVTDSAPINQLGQHADKAREQPAAKAKEQALREMDSEKQKAIGLRATLQGLKAEKDALERQRDEKARKWTEDLESIVGPMDRERKVLETVKLLHRLGWAKDRGNEEEIAEIEDGIAEVEWEILEMAIAEADEVAAVERARKAMAADREMNGGIEPESSQCFEGSGNYLSDK